MSEELEIYQRKNVADAADETGVQRLIWSSFLYVTYPMVSPALSATLIRKPKSSRISATSVSQQNFFLPCFYVSNLPGKMIRADPITGVYSLSLPIPATSPMPLLDTEDDTGKFVIDILLSREAVLGKRILGAVAYKTHAEIILNSGCKA